MRLPILKATNVLNDKENFKLLHHWLRYTFLYPLMMCKKQSKTTQGDKCQGKRQGVSASYATCILIL
jgi:hypothetical protein